MVGLSQSVIDGYLLSESLSKFQVSYFFEHLDQTLKVHLKIFSVFCTEWISASTRSTVQLFSQDRELVESDIKLQLGFFSANITLKATDEVKFPNRHWNERFQMHQVDSDYNVLLKNGVPVS